MAKQSARRYAFSVFVFDTGTGELMRAGKRLRIPDQAARLLSALLENPGAMVSREELRDHLWPAGEVVDYDRSINRTISQLRTILRDGSTRSSPLIDTLPKRGYRFTAEVRDVSFPPATLPPSPDTDIGHAVPVPSASDSAPYPEELSETPIMSAPRIRRQTWRTPLVLSVLGCSVLILAAIYLVHPGQQASLSLGIASFESDGEGAQALADSFRLNLADVLAQSPQIETRSVHAFDHLGSDETTIASRARQLGVDLVLFGKLRMKDDQCDLRLELVRMHDGVHLSSFQYSGKREELASITDRVEQDIFDRLRPAVNRAARQLGRPGNTAAYAAYLRGRSLLYAWTDDSLLRAIDAFRQALSLDPGYARAYAGLSSANFVLAQHGYGSRPHYMEEARSAATRALSIDPSLAEAHAMLGQVFMQQDWNFPAADTELNRAVELDPNHASYRQWLAISYGQEGHFQQALNEIDRAHAADPEWAPLYMTEIYLAGSAHNFGRAERAATRLLEKMPNWSLAHEQAASLYWQEEKFPQAVAEWRHAAELEKDAARMQLEDAAAAALRSGGVRACARLRLAAIHSGKGMSHAEEDFSSAEWHAYAGDYDTALSELEQQVKNRDPAALQIATNSAYLPLHGNPRYQELIRKIGPQ